MAVVLVPYSPAWPMRFEAERARLAEVFASAGVVIEHVGSTAVPGLAAKPIIDILLGAPDLASIEANRTRLETLGYAYVPEHEDLLPDRRYFVKPVAHPREVHLHAVVFDSPFWNTHLAFRDALRAHPEWALAYETLKRELAQRHREDRVAYTEGKALFIARVLSDWAAKPEKGATHGD